jgi:purine/pyrimidine-nucleoside phosphorylase
MTNQFDDVSIQKKSNVYFDGKSISRVIECSDGTKTTIGVILPTEKPLKFKTHVTEYIEIISGECEVWIGDEEQSHFFQTGEKFEVIADSHFRIHTNDVLDYVCYLVK